MKLLIIIIIWIAILIFNAIYSFLPNTLQNKPQIRYCAIVVAIIILIYGVYQVFQDYQSKIYAYVSTEGQILKSKNFPWTITKHKKEKEGEIIYILNGRYGDASWISIKLEKPNDENRKYKFTMR